MSNRHDSPVVVTIELPNVCTLDDLTALRKRVVWAVSDLPHHIPVEVILPGTVWGLGHFVALELAEIPNPVTFKGEDFEECCRWARALAYKRAALRKRGRRAH